MNTGLNRGDLLQGASGSYVIKALIDRGGAGLVYDAQRVSDRRRVAVKVLHGGRFPVTPVAKERFRREIASALKLKHRFLVEAYDAGQINDSDFLVMEHVSGGTVAREIEHGDYNDATALRWCAQMLEALRYLHDCGWIHRDLKPNNLLLSAAGELKISDLGIARDVSAEAYLTISGDQIGSVLYISRHQRQNPTEANVSDDAYSAACCMYEILSRRRLHLYPEELSKVVGERFPLYLCDLIMGCLAGLESEEALAELSRLLTVMPLEDSCLSVEALEAVVNTPIRQLAPSSQNPGLQRKRLAHSAPLRLRAEMKIPTGNKMSVEATYLSEDLLLVMTGSSNDGGKDELKLVSLADTLEIVGSTEMVSPRVRTRDALGRLVTASSAGIRVYETNRSTLEVHEIGVYRSTGLHGMTIASSRDLPLVAVGSWTDPPILLDTVTGQCRPLQMGGNVKSVGSGHVAFLEGRKLVFHQDNELVVYEVDFDRHDEIIHRWPYPREVTSLEASPELGLIFVGRLGGLECRDIKSGNKKWAVELETSGVWQVRLDSGSRVLALMCGLLESSRVALIEVDGGTMVFLPDSGENDTLRRARYFDWSPTSDTFCVSDSEDCLSVFCRCK